MLRLLFYFILFFGGGGGGRVGVVGCLPGKLAALVVLLVGRLFMRV